MIEKVRLFFSEQAVSDLYATIIVEDLAHQKLFTPKSQIIC